MQTKALSREEASNINPFIESRTPDTINAVAAGLNALRAMRVGDECALNFNTHQT